MPILEFALDTLQDHTVQVHVGTQQGPVSVMLDHAVLGTLFTLNEQTNGKEFRLPDQSVLRVSINGDKASAWRNGRPLPLTSAPLDYAQKKKEGRGSLQGNFRTVLIIDGLLLAVLTFWNFVQAYQAQSGYLAPLVLGALSILGLIGLLALGFWKKWGIYLAAITAVGALGAALALGQFDFLPVLPILVGLLLIYTLRTSGYWHQMD